MTTSKPPTNMPASVRGRLEDVARQRRVELQLLLSDFAIERLLYRLGASVHAQLFILKGATLFKLWGGEQLRATWDLDLLGRGTRRVEGVVEVVRALCGVESDDGIIFEGSSVSGEEIRIPDEYSGVRVRLDARIANARIPVQIDIAFGDAVVPAPRWEDYPTLLGHAAPRILVYPIEAVIAEKVEAIVSLGAINSRMKDFYDLHRLGASYEFDGLVLARAVRATFERRRTAFPAGEPLVLTQGFLSAGERNQQWLAFLRRCRLTAPEDAGTLVDDLRTFLLPLLDGAASGTEFRARWRPGGPWVSDAEP